MTTEKLVSVVVPCFNAASYVDDALRSILAQTYRAVEVLAVNDGSTDETQQRLEQHAKSDPRVRVITQPNKGVSAARNSGLKNARGEFVSFLDADDVLLPDKTEKQIRFLGDNPQVDLVYSDYFTGDSRLELTGLTVTRIPGTDLVEAYACKNWFAPMVPLIRRSLVERVGAFDETFRAASSEDWDFWLRCAKVGRFGYLPGAVAIYRTHPAQAHNDGARMFKAGKKYIDKHFRSEPLLYRRALAAFYEVNAKYRWAANDRLKTGLYLALSAYHNKVGAAFAHMAGAR